eukprot:scaffold1123_cov253-Pinguiococcus_pyrenoidosus.AAC.9
MKLYLPSSSILPLYGCASHCNQSQGCRDGSAALPRATSAHRLRSRVSDRALGAVIRRSALAPRGGE